MNLKDAVRQSRERGREKEPFCPSLFTQVGGLVRRHGLGEVFLRVMGALNDTQAEVLARRHRGAAKPQYEPPLFFLATQGEYQAIQQILTVLSNPYLRWARSPEELLLSPFLWRRRPDLTPEMLAERHFAELFLLFSP
ncbi:MAG: hypothetical protein ACUVXF_07415 [Desulfobaccales bacterium]